MDEIRGSPARRLSQILDPIARLATDFGSSSAPCSPRLGARSHESGSSLGQQQQQQSSTPESVRRQPVTAESGRGLSSGPDSPRLWPRQFRQAPAPPPRPRHQTASPLHHHHNNNNNNNSGGAGSGGSGSISVHSRDSPYVNVPNLLFQKDKTFAETARSAGYVELRDPKSKCSPYDFTSESSGHVEYADKRTYAAQTDFAGSTSCYEPKELTGLARGRPSFDPGPSARAHFDRAFSFSGRHPVDHQQHQQQQQPQTQQQQQPQGRVFVENRLFLDQRTVPCPDGKKEKLEARPTYGSSKSFDGYSSAVEELNWQERCLELQLELHRSRSQATRVRDMLREKVVERETVRMP